MMADYLADELDPSTGSESTQDDTAQPSSASGENRSMLDAVRDALQQGREADDDEDAEAGTPPEGESEVAQNELSGEPEGQQPDDGALDDQLLQVLSQLKDPSVRLDKIERFRSILEDRKRLSEEVAQHRQTADQLRVITDSATRAGMTNEQLANYMSLPIVLAESPAKAYEMVQDFLHELAAKAGMAIPDDIRKQIDDGLIDEDTAKRLSRAEAEARFVREQAENAQQQRRVEAEQARRATIADAVNSFQNKLMTDDPDYTQAKHEMVKSELVVLASGRIPKDAAEAVQWAREAHSRVTQRLASFAPKPSAKRTISGHRANTPTAPRPQSMKEAIAAALGGVSSED